MGAPTATITAVRRLLKDTDTTAPLLASDEIEQAISAALATYGRDRPRELVAALSGNGSAYDFAVATSLTSWQEGLSMVSAVEYPAGEQVPSYLEAGDWTIYRATDGEKLRFFATPEAGTNNILVSYTAPRSHDTVTNNVLTGDLQAFYALAGSEAALMLAAKAAASSDPTISADSADHRDGEQRWRSVAKELRARYQAHFGMGKDAPVRAAYGVGEWDTRASDGRDQLVHRRRLR
jgi:hypothetical protein